MISRQSQNRCLQSICRRVLLAAAACLLASGLATLGSSEAQLSQSGQGQSFPEAGAQRAALLRAPIEGAQDPHPPLAAANNALSLLFPQRSPSLQRGFKNEADLWVLYSEEFDRLSGNYQSQLLRKYGLVEFPAAGIRRKINDPALDLNYGVQSETSSATSGSNVVVAYNDVSAPYHGSSISYSKDGGRSWKQTSPPLFAFGQGYGDPVMAAGPDGAFYYAMLAEDGLGYSTIALTKSSDGGATWSKLINVTAGVLTQFDIHDKVWMTVDNTASPFRGSIYVSWVRFSSRRPTGIAFVRSSDGGRSWSKIQLLGEPNNARGFVQGPMIAVGPGGEIYVAYFDSRIPGIAVVKSLDGGATFTALESAIQDPSLRGGRFTLTGGYVTPPFPSIAVDTTAGPNSGAVYITLNVKPKATDESDVVLIKSSDGGATWGQPLRVNDDQTDTDQFQPSLAVAPDGTLGLMWYDRRNDPLNNVLLDVYMATSSDGGKTFRNRRVTSANWPLLPTPFGIRPGYHGDYNQMSAGSAGFVINWSDDRSGKDSDVYATVLPVSETSTDPSDFILAGKTPALNALAGTRAVLTVIASTVGGFNAPITLEASGGPAEMKYSFSAPEMNAPAEFTVTVEVPPNTTPGTYTVAVGGKAAGITRATHLRLTVYNPAEVRDVPAAISSIREPRFQPRGADDNQGNLHIVSIPASASSGLFIYSRHRDNLQVGPSVPIRAMDANVTVSNHLIGVDGAGNITVIWRQIHRITRLSNIFMSRSTDGGSTFSEPVDTTKNSSDRVTISSPALAVSKSGVINIAFVQFDGIETMQDVYFVRSTDGANFQPKVNISKSPTRFPRAFASSPLIGVDASDAVNVVYFAVSPLTPNDIMFSRSIDGVDFSTAVNVSKVAGGLEEVDVWSPGMAIDPSGTIHVIYLRADDTQDNPDVYYSRSGDGGNTFSQPALAVQTGQFAAMTSVPRVGADAAGTIGITWAALVDGPLFPGGRDVVFAKSGDGGVTFSPPVNVSNNIGHQSTTPQVITDAAGRLAVLWEDETGGNTQFIVIVP